MLVKKYNKHRETIHNFIWRSLQIGAKQGSTFLIFFISARYLDPENLGLFTYLIAISSLLIIVCDFGFTPSTSKFVAQHKAKGSKSLNRILFSITVVITGIATFVSLFIIFAGKYIFEEYSLLLYFIPYFFFLPLSSVADGAYRGLKDFKKLSIISLSAAGLALPVSFFLIRNYGLVGSIVSQNLLFFILTAGLFIFRDDIEFKIDKEVTKNIVGYALVIGLANVAFFLYTKVDILILKQFGFVAEIGYYEIINKVFTLILISSLILGQVVAPNITVIFSRNKIGKLLNKFKKYLIFSLLAGFFIAFLVYFAFPYFIRAFLKDYATDEIITIFYLLLILLPIKFAGRFMVKGLVVPSGQAKIVTINTFIFGVANVILDYLFIDIFGFVGVFYSTIIVGILSFSLNMYLYYNRLIKIRGEGK
ncbi:MAG: oligosaccharide flippase family protein [Candidatus Krumholzibacteriota bacterium]|nr:oligosaccharide flippase family protein [Candidatus Krumholzibacteriota bacterium]